MSRSKKQRRFREEEDRKAQLDEDFRIANESADRAGESLYGKELWNRMLEAERKGATIQERNEIVKEMERSLFLRGPQRDVTPRR